MSRLPNEWGLMAGSLGLAILLALWPLPAAALWWRPAWVVLVLVYWAIVYPERVGVVSGFGVGLLMDGLSGSPLGQQALSMTLIAYVCQCLYQRLRMFTVWQQVFLVLGLVSLHQLIYYWLHGLRGGSLPGLWFLLPALSSALCWPLLRRLLRRLRGGALSGAQRL